MSIRFNGVLFVQFSILQIFFHVCSKWRKSTQVMEKKMSTINWAFQNLARCYVFFRWLLHTIENVTISDSHSIDSVVETENKLKLGWTQVLMRCWMKKKDAVLTLQTHSRSLALPIDSERRISPRDNQIQIGKCAMVLIASAETSLSSNFWVVSSVQLCKQYTIEKFLPWRTSAIACLL